MEEVNLNEGQRLAATRLKSALEDARGAGLRVLIYDGAVYVCRSNINPMINNWTDVLDILDETGLNITPFGLQADGYEPSMP